VTYVTHQIVNLSGAKTPLKIRFYSAPQEISHLKGEISLLISQNGGVTEPVESV